MRESADLQSTSTCYCNSSLLFCILITISGRSTVLSSRKCGWPTLLIDSVICLTGDWFVVEQAGPKGRRQDTRWWNKFRVMKWRLCTVVSLVGHRQLNCLISTKKVWSKSFIVWAENSVRRSNLTSIDLSRNNARIPWILTSSSMICWSSSISSYWKYEPIVMSCSTSRRFNPV